MTSCSHHNLASVREAVSFPYIFPYHVINKKADMSKTKDVMKHMAMDERHNAEASLSKICPKPMAWIFQFGMIIAKLSVTSNVNRLS